MFADGSDRRYDAVSRNKLYVRIEARAFSALYGDFHTGFDQTQLARYQRTVTGVKAEGERGGVHAAAFAAKGASRHRRDEIQGSGLSGLYRLSSRAIIANSEVVSIERRDRFRSELVIGHRSLTRFIDYDIDLLSGTIRFSEPILSRDADLNPQFIVIGYKVDELSGGKLNAGARADVTVAGGNVRIGATAISDQGDGPRSELLAADLMARIDTTSELRAELAASRSAGSIATAWLVEAEHHDGSVDVLTYARSQDADFGVGQQNGVERGRRKLGVDGRIGLTEALSVTASVWSDDSLSDSSHREAAQVRADYRRDRTDLHVGVTHFSDRLADGDHTASTVLEAGGTQRLLDNKLELDATTSIVLGGTGSIDLPTRHRIGARYKVLRDVKLVGTYEIAEGDSINARTARGGLEFAPWDGARFVSTLGQQHIAEQGKRSFAAFGLAQSLPVTSRLTVDASLDGNRVLGGFDASQRDLLTDQLHQLFRPRQRRDLYDRTANTGLVATDANSIFTLDSLPAQVEVYIDDFDGAGPAAGTILFTTQNGAALTYTAGTDLKFSSASRSFHLRGLQVRTNGIQHLRRGDSPHLREPQGRAGGG